MTKTYVAKKSCIHGHAPVRYLSNKKCCGCAAMHKQKARDAGRYKESAEKQAVWRERNKRRLLLKDYGITIEQYNDMLTLQWNFCAICHRAFENDRARHVDHCHTTGKVRGILCRNCNLGLGYFKDSQLRLHSAIGYLAKAEAR